MIDRFAFLILIFLLVIPACSRQADKESDKSGDTLLKPDNGYIILLGKSGKTDMAPVVEGWESLILIAGGTVRTIEGLHFPVVSSNGHVAGISESGEVVVYYPDEESPSRFAAVEDEGKDSFNGGIGISNSGKRVYQVGIKPVEGNGEQRFAVQLVEFDTDHKRITNRVTLHEYSAERFDIDREGITGSLGLPLHVSQNGERVYITSVELDDEKRANAEKSLGVIPYKALPGLGIGVNSYVYDRESENLAQWLGSGENELSKMHLLDISRDGRTSLFDADKPDDFSGLVVVKDTAEPLKCIVPSGLGAILAPRLSSNGSKIGCFVEETEFGSDMLSPFWRANIVSTISKRVDTRFTFNTIWNAAWSDDLKFVAYPHTSFKSTIVKDDVKTASHADSPWYLHLVDIETADDDVIYVNYGKNPLAIIDIVAESEEYKDRSKAKPPVNAPGEATGSGGKSLPGKDPTQYGTGDGTSVSSK